MVLKNIRGFHLELTNICTLKCTACSRTILKDLLPTKWKNHSLVLKDIINFIDIDIRGLRFQLCGTYGDPIYYDDLFELCRWIKNNGGYIVLNTNGSYKSSKWWTELSTILNEQDEIVWGIDGLPENFTTYRVNSDWKSIKLGIDIITKTNIKTNWQFIIFQYNKDVIEQARALSLEYGMTTFSLVNTNRPLQNENFKRSDDFPDVDNEDKVTEWKYNRVINWDNSLNELDPLCLKNNSEHYISAEGYYIPCCFLANHFDYYKSYWGKNKKKHKISNNTFSKLINHSETQEFYNKLNSNNCESGCRFHCPKIS